MKGCVIKEASNQSGWHWHGAALLSLYQNQVPLGAHGLWERGSSPAAVRDSSMPSFLNFGSFFSTHIFF